MSYYIGALLVVFGLSMGQIFFKLGANALNETGSIFAKETFLWLTTGGIIYFITTIAWVWVLQKVDLGKVYPIMALAYVFVPVSSLLLLKEKFSQGYVIGVAFIILGIIIASRS